MFHSILRKKIKGKGETEFNSDYSKREAMCTWLSVCICVCLYMLLILSSKNVRAGDVRWKNIIKETVR